MANWYGKIIAVISALLEYELNFHLHVVLWLNYPLAGC